MKKLFALLLTLAILLSLAACVQSIPENTTTAPETAGSTAESTVQTTAPTVYTTPEGEIISVEEGGTYNSKEEVALYIHLYGCLPRNYVTKSYATDTLGCSTSRVQEYWPDGAIGGDIFQNREGLLPKKDGRTYYECDIDTWGRGSRGTKRIVFSSDGLVFYTDDHYASFTLMYGDPDA